MPTFSDVAIVGSGPTALSIAAHLTELGIDNSIFGPPMQFWRDMPVGIFLKSLDFATNVYSTQKGHSFIEYCKSHGLSSDEPVPMSLFAQYGVWAQERLVPHLVSAPVERVSRTGGSFQIEYSGGERVRARRCVIATGLSHFARMPEVFEGIPRELVTHSADHRDYEGFPGKKVVVIGRGSSAVEAAALLREAGTEADLLVRGYGGFLFASPPKKPRPLKERILYPMSVLGPGRTNFLLDRVPFGLHYLPDEQRVAFTRRHLGAWGPWWLADRFEGKVPVHAYTEVIGATPRGSRLALRLLDTEKRKESELVVDHVICGTGYEPDLDKLPYLDPALRTMIARLESSARLSSTFESSVPGLYFAGPVTAFSFGPLMRFVAGAEYASKAISRAIAASFGARRTFSRKWAQVGP